MKKAEFLAKLQEALREDNPIKEDDVLEDQDYWDSMSQMAVIAFFNKELKIQISYEEITYVSTVADLIKLAKDRIQE